MNCYTTRFFWYTEAFWISPCLRNEKSNILLWQGWLLVGLLTYQTLRKAPGLCYISFTFWSTQSPPRSVVLVISENHMMFVFFLCYFRRWFNFREDFFLLFLLPPIILYPWFYSLLFLNYYLLWSLSCFTWLHLTQSGFSLAPVSVGFLSPLVAYYIQCS